MKRKFALLKHDIKNSLEDRKSIILILFLILITVIVNASLIFTLNINDDSLLKQFESIVPDKNGCNLSLLIGGIFSFVIYTTFPFILGIVIVSYQKEFGELELLMLFPINRKEIFLQKILCIFSLSLFFSWISIFINSILVFSLAQTKIHLDVHYFIFYLLVIPFWLLFLSSITVIVSSTSKNSKEANQKSMIFPFILLFGFQLIFFLKINIFTEKIIYLPLLIAIPGLLFSFVYINKKLCLEKVLYS